MSTGSPPIFFPQRSGAIGICTNFRTKYISRSYISRYYLPAFPACPLYSRRIRDAEKIVFVLCNILTIAHPKLPCHPVVIAPGAEAVCPDIVDGFTNFTALHNYLPRKYIPQLLQPQKSRLFSMVLHQNASPPQTGQPKVSSFRCSALAWAERSRIRFLLMFLCMILQMFKLSAPFRPPCRRAHQPPSAVPFSSDIPTRAPNSDTKPRRPGGYSIHVPLLNLLRGRDPREHLIIILADGIPKQRPSIILRPKRLIV